MKRLIIYDLDGTIVDTREDIAKAANHMLTLMEAPNLPSDEIALYVGKGLHYLVRSCLKTDDTKKIQRAAKIYRDYYGAHMLDHSRLFPGVLETLEYFRTRMQAVITNKPDPYSTDLLQALGIRRYFSAVIAGDTGYPKKPDPVAVLAVMECHRIQTTETLFIGDSLIDVETGRNAGVETIILTHGFGLENELKSAHPQTLVHDFYELLAVAKEQGW